MEYNYNKLLGKIREKFGCNANFALKMKVSERTICLKLNNKAHFKQKEISNACKLLGIPTKDIHLYFFNKETQRN